MGALMARYIWKGRSDLDQNKIGSAKKDREHRRITKFCLTKWVFFFSYNKAPNCHCVCGCVCVSVCVCLCVFECECSVWFCPATQWQCGVFWGPRSHPLTFLRCFGLFAGHITFFTEDGSKGAWDKKSSILGQQSPKPLAIRAGPSGTGTQRNLGRKRPRNERERSWTKFLRMPDDQEQSLNELLSKIGAAAGPLSQSMTASPSSSPNLCYLKIICFIGVVSVFVRDVGFEERFVIWSLRELVAKAQLSPCLSSSTFSALVLPLHTSDAGLGRWFQVSRDNPHRSSEFSCQCFQPLVRNVT